MNQCLAIEEGYIIIFLDENIKVSEKIRINKKQWFEYIWRYSKLRGEKQLKQDEERQGCHHYIPKFDKADAKLIIYKSCQQQNINDFLFILISQNKKLINILFGFKKNKFQKQDQQQKLFRTSISLTNEMRSFIRCQLQKKSLETELIISLTVQKKCSLNIALRKTKKTKSVLQDLIELQHKQSKIIIQIFQCKKEIRDKTEMLYKTQKQLQSMQIVQTRKSSYIMKQNLQQDKKQDNEDIQEHKQQMQILEKQKQQLISAIIKLKVKEQQLSQTKQIFSQKLHLLNEKAQILKDQLKQAEIKFQQQSQR